MKKLVYIIFTGLLFLTPAYGLAAYYGGQYDNSGSITAIGTYPIRIDTALGQASTTQSTGDAWLIIDVASCTPDCDFYTANGGDGGWKINDGTTDYTTDYQGWKWQDGLGHLDSWKITQTGKVGLKFTGLKWETGKTYTLRWGTFDSPGGLTLKANAAGTIPTYQLSDTYLWETPGGGGGGGGGTGNKIEIGTGIATNLLANISNQLADLGTIGLLALVAGIPLAFYVIKRTIRLLPRSKGDK